MWIKQRQFLPTPLVAYEAYSSMNGGTCSRRLVVHDLPNCSTYLSQIAAATQLILEQLFAWAVCLAAIYLLCTKPWLQGFEFAFALVYTETLSHRTAALVMENWGDGVFHFLLHPYHPASPYTWTLNQPAMCQYLHKVKPLPKAEQQGMEKPSCLPPHLNRRT